MLVSGLKLYVSRTAKTLGLVMPGDTDGLQLFLVGITVVSTKSKLACLKLNTNKGLSATDVAAI